MSRPPALGQSPPWSIRSKRTVVVGLVVVGALLAYQLRAIAIPLILALVVAYVVLPIVNFLHRRTRLTRSMAIAVVYLVILALLLAIPITTIPALINQTNVLQERIPFYLEQLGLFLSRPLTIAGFTIPLDEYTVLDQVYENLADNVVSIAQTVGRQSVAVLGNIAGATLSTIAWIIVVLVLSFYMVKDYKQLFASMVALVPVSHQGDVHRLGWEVSATWNAFLRGQLVLCLVIGAVTFVVALAVGLPNALVLALIAGIMEFIPNLGPVLAAIPAVLVALFQYRASWLGVQLSPVLFAGIVLGLYVLIQQLENIVLVPRIIGRRLNLHPFVVFLGAIAGASVAGILGILLAAPVLSTVRILIVYTLRKLSDLPPFPLTDPTEPAADAIAANTGDAEDLAVTQPEPEGEPG